MKKAPARRKAMLLREMLLKEMLLKEMLLKEMLLKEMPAKAMLRKQRFPKTSRIVRLYPGSRENGVC